MFESGGFLGQVRIFARGQSWWRHHIEGTRAYLESTAAGDSRAAVQALVGLWNGVESWQRLTGSIAAGLLMGEHTVLAKLLIDCGSQACTNSAAEALGRNVEAQGRLFPRDPAGFAARFAVHVAITGDYIAAYKAGDLEAFGNAYQEAIANGAQLGAFTDRIFFGPRIA